MPTNPRTPQKLQFARQPRTLIIEHPIDTEWKLLTPDGAVAWTGGDGMVFDPAHSKYTDRQKSGYTGFGPAFTGDPRNPPG